MLNETSIRKAKANVKLDDNGQPVMRGGQPLRVLTKVAHRNGLYLEIRPSGEKQWRYRYRLHGKKDETRDKVVEHIYSIGQYFDDKRPGHVSLEAAERLHAKARALVKQGIHPLEQDRQENRDKQAARESTFQAVATEWLGWKRSEWTARHSTKVEQVFKQHVFPDIGGMPVGEIGAPDIRRIMEKAAGKGIVVTALNIRQWCSGVFCYAMNQDSPRIKGDPTTALRGSNFHIKRPKVQHKTPLNKDGIAELLRRVDTAGFVTTQIALKLLMYLFVRPGELRRAEWSEFDLERGVWVIPAEKMKKREKHLVPLSPQAIALLRELHVITGARPWLFPNHRNPKTCMSEGSMNNLLRRLGYEKQFSAHGFRATASTELHEMGFSSEIIELQLAHTERDETKASYNQAQFWERRTAMMSRWADVVDAWARGAAVIPINRPGNAKQAI